MLEKEFKDDPDKLVININIEFSFASQHSSTHLRFTMPFQYITHSKTHRWAPSASSTPPLATSPTAAPSASRSDCELNVACINLLSNHAYLSSSPWSDERGSHAEANHWILLHDSLQQWPQLQGLPQKVKIILGSLPDHSINCSCFFNFFTQVY